MASRNGLEVRAGAGAENADLERAVGLGGAAAAEAAQGHRGGAGRCDGEDLDLGADLLEGGLLLGVEGVDGVVSALDVDMGADGPDELGDALLAEDGDAVDAAEPAEDLGAVALGVDGAGRALEGADGDVAIEGDDEGHPRARRPR